MRAVELGKVAAAAEALRLRRLAQRQVMRGAYGAGAAVFGIAVVVLLHVIAYDLLTMVLSAILSSVVLLVFDLVVAGVLGMLAMRNSPSHIEQEALEVRRQAVAQMKRSVTFMAAASQVASLVVGRRFRTATSSAPRGRAWMLGQLASRVLARR